jgi:RNA polymerase sigma factor (sigma-70 family)
MTTNRPQPHVHADRNGPLRSVGHKRRRRGPCLAPVDAGQALTAKQLDELWAAYVADRADLRLRNRLVEHYLPRVRALANSIAHQLALRDTENAVGEVLAALVSSIVPGYDGRSGFERWLRVCTRRKLIDQQRAERNAGTIFADLPSGPAELDLLPSPEQRGCDLKFLELTAELSDRQAAVLWLRHYRGLSVGAVSALLTLSPGAVKACTHDAVLALRKKWAGSNRDEIPAY